MLPDLGSRRRPKAPAQWPSRLAFALIERPATDYDRGALRELASRPPRLRLSGVAGERMRTLLSGSFAYDSIMVFPDRFKNHILPDKVHMLNVSFMVPEMRREFGGCAGNIAYG